MTSPLYLHLATTAQLINRGFTPRTLRKRVAEGQLVKVRPSVFTPAQWWNEAFPSDRYIAQCYAWSLISPQAVFSHDSSAALLGLSLLSAPHFVSCYSLPSSRGRVQNIRLFPRLDDDVRLVRSEQGVMCTDTLTTINDCARTLDLQSALVVANSALYRRLVNLEELTAALNVAGRGSRNSRHVAELKSRRCESPGKRR